jgi:TPR repeat protein
MSKNDFLDSIDFFADDDISIEELERRVKEGDTDAMVKLALELLYDWDNVELNPERAIMLLSEASNARNASASSELANIFGYGIGTYIDLELATLYHKRYVLHMTTEEYNYATAETKNLFGRLKGYLCRDLGELDEKNAKRLFEIAQNSNYPSACEMLGILYQYGVGTQKSLDLAIESYNKMERPHGRLCWLYYEMGDSENAKKHLALDENDPICIAYKGILLLNEGKDDDAFETMCQSSRQGSAHGHFALGKYYESKGDNENAVEHYDYARANGYFGLDEIIEKLEG